MIAKPVIVFFGSDAICLPVLDYLLHAGAAHCSLRAVVSQPDRRQGRGKRLHPNPVAAWASANSIELLQPEKPDRELAEWIAAEKTVVALVMAYGHFLGKSVREAPRYGMLNFHGSMLPAYRGASPIETAVAMGDSETGVCLMQVVKEMDAGAVADCERVAILPTETGPEVRAKVGAAVVPLLRRNLADVISGDLEFEPQDAALATRCRKLRKEDAFLDFTQSAQAIYDRLRAFTPWPGGSFEHEGVRIKVGRASVAALPDTRISPGTVISQESSLCIATAAGQICFHELQRPGGRLLPVSDFLRGYQIPLGSVLASVPCQPLVFPV